MKKKMRFSMTLLLVVMMLIAGVALSADSSLRAWADEEEPVSVTGVTLFYDNNELTEENNEISLEKGSDAMLTAEDASGNDISTTVEWSSSVPKVATVEKGKITALAPGTATIKATAGEESASCTVNVNGISLNKDELTITDESSDTLSAEVYPAGSEITWTSSKEEVATVSEDGKVTAVAPGEATITASITVGETTYTDTCAVTVNKLAVESVSLDKDSISLVSNDENNTETLIATVKPDNASYPTVTWSTSNAEVATVENGTVSAVAAGTATITATADGQSATCTVTVNTNGISLNKDELTITDESSETLSAEVYPAGSGITWTSSKEEVATVSEDGKVTAVAPGEATITASITVGETTYTDTCAVTVNKLAVESVSLDKDSISLVSNDDSNKTATLTATVDPANASYPTVTWSTSNAEVATVENGNVTAVGNGEANIYATADGVMSSACVVTVTTNVTGVTVSGNDVHDLLANTGADNHTLRLSASVLPETPNQATYDKVTWNSSAPAVATVDESGLVTAVKSGTAEITASAVDKDGKVLKTSDPYNITVRTNVEELQFLMDNYSMQEGTSETWDKSEKIIILPNGTDGPVPDKGLNDIAWNSSNINVVGISTYSDRTKVRVNAYKEGEATITGTITNYDGTEVSAQCKIVVSSTTVAVTGLELDTEDISDLAIGGEKTITAAITPDNATNKGVSWRSSKPSVATVEADSTDPTKAVVKGIAAGETTIIAQAEGGNVLDMCTVTVASDIVSVEGVEIGATVEEINVGEKLTLTANIKPSNATNKNVTWSSGDESIATVDENGILTALAEGEVTITVTTEDGSKTDSVVLKVKNVKSEKLEVTPSEASIIVGGTIQLSSKITPDNTTNKTITWTSSDTSVAKVDKNGLVTGVELGKATITATTADNSTAICEITVANDQVTGLQALAFNKKIRVNWDKVEDAEGYHIMVRYAESGDLYKTYDTENTYCNFTELTNGTEYSFMVCAYFVDHTIYSYGDYSYDDKETIHGGYSKEVIAKPYDDRVKNLTADPESKKIILSWDASKDTDGYYIYAMYADGSKYKTYSTAKTKCNFNNLTNGKEYKFKIRTYKVDSTGKKVYGDYNYTVSAVPQTASSLAQVKNLKALEFDQKVRVNWNAVSGAKGYRVSVTYASNGKPYKTYDTTNLYCNFTKLKNGTNYNFKVCAYSVNSAGNKILAEYSDTVKAKPYNDKVTDLKATAYNKKITLSWSAVDRADGYYIYAMYADGSKYKTYATTKTTCNFNDLKNGETYSFKIRTYKVDSTGKKVYSTYCDAVSKYPTIDAVSGLEALTFNKKVRIDWKAKSGAEGYYIYATKDGSKYKTYKTTKTYCNFTDLTNGSKYTFKVRAYYSNSNGKTVYGKYCSAVAAVPNADKVVNLKAAPGDSKVSLSWDAFDGADGYYIYAMYADGSKYKTYSTTKTTCNFNNLKNGKKYSFKVRMYKTDQTGAKIYGTYSKTVSATPSAS